MRRYRRSSLSHRMDATPPSSCKRDLLYRSRSEFLAEVAENPRNAREGQKAGWAEATYDEAMDMAVNGWPEGAETSTRIAESALRDVNGPVANTFQATWELSGGEVDMSRYLIGIPECMIEYEPVKVSNAGKVVRLVYAVTVSGSLSADSYLKRGAAIVALAMALEQSQHSVEIWLDRTVTDYGIGEARRTRVLIKEANDAIDDKDLAYWLAHPSVLRQLCFRVDASGTPCDPMEDMEEGTIYIPTVRSAHDIPEAVDFVRDHLVALGLIDEQEEE